MPRTTLALTSFVSGEFGSKLTGRTDFEKYSQQQKQWRICYAILKERQQEE